MKPENSLRNNLRQIRTRLSMSQQDLADLSGVSRQTISGVESGQYAPSTTLAIKMAGALGCRVEDLFWLQAQLPDLEALPAAGMPTVGSTRVALTQVGGRWVAHPLVGEKAFRHELVPADGEGAFSPDAHLMRVRPLDTPGSLAQSVAIAGCAPALSLWARAAERWHPGLRVHWVFANSTDALLALARGEIHAAGVHFGDPDSGEQNTTFVRRLLPGRAALLINLGTWEEGLLVPPGNPLSLFCATDLTRPEISIVNREPGAGSRQLLDWLVTGAGIAPSAVRGFDRIVHSHLEVARTVALGQAYAGVSAASVASAFGLGFVPLHRVRYDMVLLRNSMAEQPVRQLLGTLNHPSVQAQLESLGSFDTSQTGEIVAEVT